MHCLAGSEDFLVILLVNVGHGTGIEIMISFSDEIFRLGTEDVGAGTVREDDDTGLVFEPKHDLGEGFEQAEGYLT